MKIIISIFILSISILQTSSAQDNIIIQERMGITRNAEPVTLGIPFKKGILNNINNISISNNGTPIDAQFKTMSLWNDGSVKWAKADFQANVTAGSVLSNYVITTNSYNSFENSNLIVAEDTDLITINTGIIEFAINKKSFNLFHYVKLDLNNNGIYSQDEVVIAEGVNIGPEVVNNNDIYQSRNMAPSEIFVEESGPMKVVVKISGYHSNGSGSFLKYETRLYAYNNKGFIKVRHSYANDTSVASLNDPGDPTLGANIDGYSINLNSNLSSSRNITLGGSSGLQHSYNLSAGNSLQLVQHDRSGTSTPLNYSILRNGNLEASGDRAEGWAIISDENMALGVSISDFWEKYPKGILIDQDGSISLQAITDDPEFLFVGMGASDEYLIYFMSASDINNATSELQALTRSPLIAHCSTERFQQTDVFYKLSDCYGSSGANLISYINETSDNHLFNRADQGMYSNLCYGDVPRDFYEFDDENVMTSIWGNNYYDCALTTARLFVLTEDTKYYDIFNPMTRHWMETDTWNTGDGDWLNGYCPSYSLNHRSNPNFNHHYGEGVWYYYYLTGDERAKEIGIRAAKSIDEEQFWANENVLLRGASLRGAASLEAYKATDETRYLQRARQQIDAIMSTQNQYGMVGNSMDNGNDIQGGQTFMMGLFSDLVWKYLQEDFDPGLRDQLLKLADFVHEYARVPGGQEEYYNFWNSPNLPGAPQPDLIGSQDDFVYWNGKGLISGLYAYAYYFSNDQKYKTYSANLLNHMWGPGYLDAFGFDFWGKASAQGMKNVLHAASIICQEDFITPTSNLDLSDAGILIFPNPTSDYFIITGDLNDYNLELLNVQGSVIQNLNTDQNIDEIELSGLGAGIYFLRAWHRQNNKLHIEIIIKQ